MFLINALIVRIVPDCDTVLDWLAASSIAVNRQLRSIGRRRCWTCLCVRQCLQVAVSADRSGERWRRRRADSPPPGNQVPDQSSTGKPRQRSGSRHVVVLVASGAVAVSVWCGRAIVHRLSAALEASAQCAVQIADYYNYYCRSGFQDKRNCSLRDLALGPHTPVVRHVAAWPFWCSNLYVRLTKPLFLSWVCWSLNWL